MGITFRGQHSDEFNIAVRTEDVPGLANKRHEIHSVPGRNGGYIVEDGYDNKILRFNCTIYAEEIIDRRKNIRDIMKWLSGTGDLILDNEPDIIYQVIRTVSNISVAITGYSLPTDTFSIEFECKPMQVQTFYNDNITWEDADMAWKYADIPWDGYDRIFSPSAGESMDLVNVGTFEAEPIIKLSGIAASITFTTNTQSFTYTGLSGDIYIDCVSMDVYSISGGNKVNEIANFEGDFIVLESGTTTIDVTGTITSLDVEFDYKNTYL